VLAPADLAAKGEDGQVSLSWSTTGGATGYVVRRGVRAGGPYAEVATQQAAGYVDTGLSAATTYYYVVHAVGPGGPGADSAEASALTVPSAPAHLRLAASARQISLAWDTVPGATGYRILRAGTSGGFSKLTEVPATPAAYLDAGLAGGTTWTYQVAALDASGSGAPSPSVSATAGP
jgi:fibronectin type 3 domain-containing protein